MVPLLPLLPFLSLLTPTLARSTAGNENYHLTSHSLVQRSGSSAARRSPWLKRWSGATSGFASESVSFSVDDTTYLSPTGAQFQTYDLEADWYIGANGQEEEAKRGERLVTVFKVDGEVGCKDLEGLVGKYSSMDDVWSEAFLQTIVLTSTSSYHLKSEVAECAKGWGGSMIVKAGKGTSNVKGIDLSHVTGDSVPPGPYYAQIHASGSLTLSKVYRMYPDTHQAFTTPVIPTVNNTFVSVAASVEGLNTLSIPVPSRLYTKYLAPGEKRSLEGRRVAVKDLFDMAGVRTGGGSRAYWGTYPEREATAFAIQRLVDQGAVIVGRVKTSQFANGETATGDWVDQLSPFNPRGDGYQQPSSSSSGSGASIAAYDWLDNTIGSDTGGSVTGPAGAQGVYGLRPTWGAISLEGVLPLQATQDTAGFFDRSAVKGRDFAKGWYGDQFESYAAFPETLIFPNSSWTFPPTADGSEQPYAPILNSFRSSLISLISNTSTSPSIDTASFETYWNSTGRFESLSGNSSTYLQGVYGTLITYYQYNNFALPWFEDYASQNEGRTPFVSPSPLVRWAYGRDNVSQAAFEDATAKKEEYGRFINEDVLQEAEGTCSRAIYVQPLTVGTTSYRNIYRPAPGVPLSGVYTSPFSGVPQLVIPVGQVPYTSTISNITEYLPVTVTLFAARGCDYMLWDLAAKLEEAGVTKAVKAGRTPY